MKNIKRNFYSKLDLAMELGICVRSLDTLMANGKISYSKIGGRVIFSQQDLDEFIARSRKPAFNQGCDLEEYIKAEQNKVNN